MLEEKTYYDNLPASYFDGALQRILTDLIHGQNVLISSIYGSGARTFLNLINDQASKYFPNIFVYDPEINSEEIFSFLESLSSKHKTLVIVKSLNKLWNKNNLLEKLSSFKMLRHKNLVFLCFTDHTGITKPNDYFGQTSIFFSSCYYLKPFSEKDVAIMVKSLNKYFNWEINMNLIPQITKLSGGNPRLIKYIVKSMSEDEVSIENLEHFLEIYQIQFQLNYLNQFIYQHRKQDLIKLGLLNTDGTIKSQLLKLYHKNYQEKITQDLYPNLTPLEAKLFSLFYLNMDHLITIDQIGDLLELSGHEFSPWAIYKLISRLKRKVGNNFEIKNTKSRGYILNTFTPYS